MNIKEKMDYIHKQCLKRISNNDESDLCYHHEECFARIIIEQIYQYNIVVSDSTEGWYEETAINTMKNLAMKTILVWEEFYGEIV